MSEQSRLLDQHQLLASVRALLATVQQPLGALDGALAAPEQLLTELAPALAVVDFSPFAQLTVNGADTRQPAPKPAPHSTGILPVATTAAAAVSQAPHAAPPSSTRPGAAPQTTLTSDPVKPPPPVFSLPSQKRVAKVGVSPSASRDASLDHSLAQLVMPPTPLVSSEGGYADRSAPLSSHGDDDLAHVLTAAPLSAAQRTQQGGSLPGIDTAAEPPLATMSLVATVVDSLLTTPAAPGKAVATQATSASSVPTVSTPSSSPTGSRMQWPTTHESAIPSGLPSSVTAPLPGEQPPVVTPPLNAPPADLTSLLTSWPSVGHEHQPTNQPTNQLTNQPTNQPTLDPWALAQLINDVLAEEARRHGVDLS